MKNNKTGLMEFTLVNVGLTKLFKVVKYDDDTFMVINKNTKKVLLSLDGNEKWTSIQLQRWQCRMELSIVDD